MATLEKWSDGYDLNMDPRREDPLFYYRPASGWDDVIGFEVLPLYEERSAGEVTISVWKDHRDREASLEPEARELMYVRCVPSLAAYHDSWQVIRLVGEDLEAVLASGELEGAMNRHGFSLAPASTEDSATWARE
jgi:hypothetical protein